MPLGPQLTLRKGMRGIAATRLMRTWDWKPKPTFLLEIIGMELNTDIQFVLHLTKVRTPFQAIPLLTAEKR